MDENYKFIRTIGYLGLLPFFAGAIISMNLISIPSNISEFIKLFSVHYASVILSFMGGVLWGFEISDSKSVSRKKILDIGSSSQFFSRIHIDDLTSMLMASMLKPNPLVFIM